MSEYVQISKTVAIWLVKYGRNLVEAGLGTTWDPNSRELPELEPGGLIDQLNLEEYDLYHWTNSLMNLAKTVAGILAQILKEDAENNPPIRLLDINPDNEI
jgi:hypothetical protein